MKHTYLINPIIFIQIGSYGISHDWFQSAWQPHDIIVLIYCPWHLLNNFRNKHLSENLSRLMEFEKQLRSPITDISR